MASWTSPRTWVAGAVVTAAQLNAHLRDNLQALLPLDQVAWTSYTPTLTQSGAVTKTVTQAKYTQIGKMVTCAGFLTCTGSGTANNPVQVSLPVTAATWTVDVPLGVGAIHDQSAATFYPVIAVWVSTTIFKFLDTTTGTNVAAGQTGSSFAAALVNTDTVQWIVSYEAA